MDDRPVNNLNFRIAICSMRLRKSILKRFFNVRKSLRKNKDVSYVYEMVANTGGDLLRQYIIHPDRHDEKLAFYVNLWNILTTFSLIY